MADKHIIHGATFNGDGTTSSEAGSNGAAGAWNTINYLTGTTLAYGALNSGDVVHIRSKTSAGADITVSFDSANVTIGSTNATAASPIRWILDGGTKWSGINGTLTFSASANDTYDLITVANNVFECETQDAWVLSQSNSAVDTAVFVSGASSEIRKWLIDFSGSTADSGAILQMGENSRQVGCHYKVKRCSSMFATGGAGANGDVYHIINPDIEVITGFAQDAGTGLFVCGDRGGRVDVYGGRIRSAVSLSGFRVHGDISNVRGNLTFFGTQIPKEASMVGTLLADATQAICAFGLDDGMGAFLATGWGTYDSRDDGNYPVLNATLPDSGGTGVAFKLYPAGCSQAFPAVVTVCTKMYTAAAASKTVTLELQVSEDFGTPGKRDVYLEVFYTKSDGTPGYESSRDWANGALSTSSVEWVPNVAGESTYGATALDRYKLAVTTAASIKQDTPVTCRLSWGLVADSATKLVFVCPDVQLSS